MSDVDIKREEGRSIVPLLISHLPPGKPGGMKPPRHDTSPPLTELELSAKSVTADWVVFGVK